MSQLETLFNPKSIAVIGASRTPGKIGYYILENLKNSFSGPIYPINPNATEILNLATYPTVLNVEEPIDLAIICVPAEIVKSVLEECIKKKIKDSIIISAGFSEIGRKDLELELKTLAKNKIRILGPNCMGFYRVGLDTFFSPKEKLKRPREGFIGFLTQSGAVGISLMDTIANEGVGVSKVISYGNKIDIDEIELLDYFGKDLQTRCIAMYLESVDRGAEFMKLASSIIRTKPIVILKAGKTAKGTQAVASHTGAMAGPAEIYSAAFKQSGIVEARTTEELFDYAKILATQPLLNGNRIAIVTDGGGFGILAADAAVEAGFEMPEISKETIKRMKGALPQYASVANPIDLTGDSDSERYRAVLEAIFKDKTIDGVICISLMQVPAVDVKIVDIFRDAKMYGKPFAICAPGGEYTLKAARLCESFGVPVYSTPERAVRAMKILRDYSELKRSFEKKK